MRRSFSFPPHPTSTRYVLFVLVLFLILPAHPARAQFVEPVYSASTPDVATLGTYGEIPVSLFTGTPEISVPIYEVTAGEFSFPIALSYHLASVKPNLPPGNYGLGWSLSTEACISRTVRGFPDEKMDNQSHAVGFYGHYSDMQGITPSSFAAMTAAGFNAPQSFAYELSADEFSFSFNGYSGNFYLNPEGGWTVVSDQDIKVEFDPQTGFLGPTDLVGRIPKINCWTNRSNCTRWFGTFTLITPDGTRYTFGGVNATDFSIDYYARNSSDLIATAWHLAQITTPQGRQINFSYATEDRPLMLDIRYVTSRRTTYGVPAASYDYLHVDMKGRRGYSGFLLFPARLESVTSPNETVELTYAYDWNYGARFLNETPDVLYWDDSNQRGGNIFHYDTGDPRFFFFELLPAENAGTQHANRQAISACLRHDFLHRITIRHAQEGCDRSIYLEYDGLWRKRLSALFWREGVPELEYEYRTVGNIIYPLLRTPADTSKTSLPRWYFHYDTARSMPKSTVFAATDAWGYWAGFSKSPSFSYFEDQNPLPALPIFARAETLRAITFPTGGSARFEYEGHSYSKIIPDDHGNPVAQSGAAGGLRLKTLVLADRTGKVISKKIYHYAAELGSSTNSGISSGNPSHRKTFAVSGGNVIMDIESEYGFPSTSIGVNTPAVGYSSVIEEMQDSTGSALGFIRYRFSNFDTDIFGQPHPDQAAFYAYNVSGNHSHVPYSSNAAERGHLLSKEYFRRDTVLERKEIWRYERVRNDSLTTATQEVVIFSADPQAFVSATIGWLTQTKLFSYLPAEETVYEYTNSGTLTSTTYHFYNDNRLPVRDSTRRSDRSFAVRHYTYPADHPLQYGWMVSRHILSPNVSVRTVTPEKTQYRTAAYASVQGPLGAPVPYLSSVTSGMEGGTLVRTHFQISQSGPWGNQESILQDGLRTTVSWDPSGQRPTSVTSLDPDSVPQRSSPSQSRTIPGSTLPLFLEPDGSQTRRYMYNAAHDLMYAFEPNGLAARYGYDALGRLDAVMECDISDNWTEDRTIQRHRYGFQLTSGAVLPPLSSDGVIVPVVTGPDPERAIHAQDGASDVYPRTGKAYEAPLEFRHTDYHIDSLSNICRLTLDDTLQIRFDICDFQYYRSLPSLNPLPSGDHPLVLKLYHTPPHGGDSLIVNLPFQLDGETLAVSINQNQWPASDSVIVDLLPGWYRVEFLGIDTTSVYEPLLRGRSSVVMTDFPSFNLRMECLPLDVAFSSPEPEPEPEPITSWNFIASFTSKNGTPFGRQVSFDWLDDFGRKESTQSYKASPSGKDLVEMVESDALGRPSREWITTPVPSTERIPFNPGVQLDPFDDIQHDRSLPDNVAASAADCFGETERPFTEYGYGFSSQNRPVLSYGPGAQWYTNGKAIQTEYLTNVPGNSQLGCRRFTYTPHVTNIWTVTSPGYYAAGTLHVTRVTDEDGRTSLTFEDLDGNTVLTRSLLPISGGTRYLDTYYVYDAFGNLLAVLPPLASSAIQNNGSIPDTDVQRYAYLYRYDDLGRNILKKLPGAEPVYYIYDNAHRIILTQDGNARAKGQVVFSLYDVFGRLCVTGVCSNSISVGNHIDAIVKAHYTGSGTLGGYAVEGLTLSNPQVLSVNWYDNYSFISDVLGQTAATTDTVLLYGSPAARTDALPTGSWMAVLDGTESVPEDAIWSIVRYDRRNRPAKTVSSDHLGGWTTEDVQYTFQGSPSTRSIVHHEPSGRTRTETYAYTYDSQDRLLSVGHSLDGGTSVVLTQNSYDDLGRLASSGHAGKDTLSLSYSYNIRSQTTDISGPLFSERLYYEQAPTASPNVAVRYGGGISSMEWKAGAMSSFAGWDFSYDGIGRLTGSDYRFGSTLSDDYDTSYSYDDHGNILSIQEAGLSVPLRTFSYTGNHLTGRSYDANGNLTGSFQHEPFLVEYNILNLPELILRSFGSDSVRYAYAADGTKLRETVSKQGIVSSKSDYVLNRVYRDDALSLLITDAGYLAFPDSVAGVPNIPDRVFLLRDHLGSVRVAADTVGFARQINHYYPYGGDLTWESSGSLDPDEPIVIILDPEEPGIIDPDEPIVPTPEDPDMPALVEISNDNPFKFIGKEPAGGRGLVLYDFGARFYTPSIPRWTSMDSLAEKYYSISPYAYCAGDPMNYVDLNGNDYYYLNSDGSITYGFKDGDDPDNDYLVWGYYNKGTDGPIIYIRVIDKSILWSLSIKEGEKAKSSHNAVSSSKEIIDLFDFIIHHSEQREWSIASFKGETEERVYGLVQGEKGSSVSCPSTIDGLNEIDMIAKIHTHEGYIQEHGASGDYREPLAIVYTDRYNYKMMLERSKTHHFKMPRHYVYEVPYKALYEYNDKKGDYYLGVYNKGMFKRILQ